MGATQGAPTDVFMTAKGLPPVLVPDEQPEDGKPPHDVDLRHAFHHSVAEGKSRLKRTWPGLFATGAVGGLDVGLGVVAAFAVLEATGSQLLAALAFTIGFIALSLGKSELFTENFLVPIAALVTGHATVRELGRLWAGTALGNLVGGWVLAALLVSSVPQLRPVAVEAAMFYATRGPLELMGLALLAGVVITLMTWMENGARSEPGRLVAVMSAAFLFEAVPLNHVIITSIILFAGIMAGGPIGYLDWAYIATIAAIGNMLGGLVLVTLLRLVQVGWKEIEKEQEQDEPTMAEE